MELSMSARRAVTPEAGPRLPERAQVREVEDPRPGGGARRRGPGPRPGGPALGGHGEGGEAEQAPPPSNWTRVTRQGRFSLPCSSRSHLVPPSMSSLIDSIDLLGRWLAPTLWCQPPGCSSLPFPSGASLLTARLPLSSCRLGSFGLCLLDQLVDSRGTHPETLRPRPHGLTRLIGGGRSQCPHRGELLDGLLVLLQLLGCSPITLLGVRNSVEPSEERLGVLTGGRSLFTLFPLFTLFTLFTLVALIALIAVALV